MTEPAIKGTSTGFEPVENLSDLPVAVEVFELLTKVGQEIEMDCAWEDIKTGKRLGRRVIRAEVIAEWTRDR